MERVCNVMHFMSVAHEFFSMRIFISDTEHART